MKSRTHCSRHGRGTWKHVVMGVERMARESGRVVGGGWGGGEEGESVCFRRQMGHGNWMDERVLQDMQAHLLLAARNWGGGGSLAVRWKEAMCAMRLLMVYVTQVLCVGQVG